MNIVDDEEFATVRSEAWPARADRYLERRPWLAVGTSAVVLMVVALLAVNGPANVRTAAQPTPTTVPNPAPTVQPLLPGLAFLNTAPAPDADYDLLFSITAGPPPGTTTHRGTSLYRLDAVTGDIVPIIDRWSASEREARIFADPRGRAMVVAGQDTLMVFFSARALAGARGGRPLDVVSVLFVGPDNDPPRVLASTNDSVVDITLQGRRPVVANVGGTLLGQLDDGRAVLGTMAGTDLIIRAVSLDGAVSELGRVPQALGAAALERFPTSTSSFRVLALRRDQVPGGSVLSGVDLGTGAISDLEVVGLGATFAPVPGRPGVYVYAHRPEPYIDGRETSDIQVPAARCHSSAGSGGPRRRNRPPA